MISSKLSNTLSLTKVVLGTTLVLYPQMFKENGILPMILSIILIGGFLCSTSLYFLYISSVMLKCTTYEELGERVLGRATRRSIEVSIFLIGFFSLMVYLRMCGELVDNVSGCGVAKSKIVATILCGVLSSFSSTISRLKIVNLIGLGCLFILISTVFYQFLGNFKGFEGVNFKTTKTGFFNNFGIISLCFCSHFVIIPFFNSTKEEEYENVYILSEPTRDGSTILLNSTTKDKDGLWIIVVSSFLSVFVYIFVGLFGYLSFPDTEENWAKNAFSNSLLNLFLSILLIAVIVLSYPLCVVASRDMIPCMRSYPIASIWILTGVSSIFVFLMKDYSIISILFLSFGSLVMFIYPSIFYLKVVRPVAIYKRLLGGVTLTVGIIMMIQSLKGMIQSF
ncbi:hypothetical protein NGRA_3159 [Nosema granulosis]|uniref:Amino acid transporter transmembrane domain-containing protein n=1 Tax=Nosema granulosis TaxID=83296 RepID=A0A9P6GVA4_9MICR|nr:hypothetical protein NGRA_3159 [Nosema granulosis]